jgi:predicted hydrolase (HD superfamily)
MSQHGIVAARILEAIRASPAVVYAVKSHDDRSGFPRKSKLDHALYCADQIYWLFQAIGAKYDVESAWKEMQALTAKKAVVEKLQTEAPQAGFSIKKLIELSLEAMGYLQLPRVA